LYTSPPIALGEPVCAADADLIFRSCDGRIFNVHKKDFEMHSEGFAAATVASEPSSGEDPETVTLTETAPVLELLLQYIYRQPQPDLQNVDFEILAGVAEVAEKYQVYSATCLCKILMESVSLFNFCLLHGLWTDQIAD
jgi:hypothetical protein